MSLKKALEAQGFIGGSRSDTEWNQWVASEKEVLSQILSIEPDRLSIKAKTNEKMDAVGQELAIEAHAVVLLKRV